MKIFYFCIVSCDTGGVYSGDEFVSESRLDIMLGFFLFFDDA
jgi:hypothetical protein